MINIIEVDGKGGIYADGGTYANDVLAFPVDPTEYTGRKVLAVPRCCQKKKGTQDRRLINRQVAERDSEVMFRKRAAEKAASGVVDLWLTCEGST